MGAQCSVLSALKRSFQIHLLSGEKPQTTCRNAKPAAKSLCQEGLMCPPHLCSSLQVGWVLPVVPHGCGALVGALLSPGEKTGAEPQTLLPFSPLYWLWSSGERNDGDLLFATFPDCLRCFHQFHSLPSV